MAIKIIKEGTFEPKKYVISCSRCGCVFEATEEEDIKSCPGIPGEIWESVACPCCGKGISRGRMKGTSKYYLTNTDDSWIYAPDYYKAMELKSYFDYFD